MIWLNCEIGLQIEGTIVAPDDIGAWTDREKWLVFSNVNKLSVKGNGKIDGRGAAWWKQVDKPENRPSVSIKNFHSINS